MHCPWQEIRLCTTASTNIWQNIDNLGKHGNMGGIIINWNNSLSCEKSSSTTLIFLLTVLLKIWFGWTPIRNKNCSKSKWPTPPSDDDIVQPAIHRNSLWGCHITVTMTLDSVCVSSLQLIVSLPILHTWDNNIKNSWSLVFGLKGNLTCWVVITWKYSLKIKF